MKSVERHKLETNWLAKHLNEWVEKVRPYSSTIAGIIVAIVVLMFGWSFISGASTTREKEAWNAFNTVVGGSMDEQSISELGTSVEEFSDTDMKDWGKVTWADGQVWTASRYMLQNREVAMSALDEAASKYQSVITSSSDQSLVDRSRFGLARVYEMRNEPDKARDEYLKVQGSFATIAQQRAEALAEEKTKETLNWLAHAVAPQVAAPRGPGIPGMRPPLDVQDITLPGAAGAADPTKTEINIDELFKGLGELGKDAAQSTERYPTGEPKPGDAAAKSDEKATPGQEKPASGETPRGSGDKGPGGTP
ncbi:MAG: tetratricopeptide repeat protein [Pirellulales bacterium]